jgi:broad specificity phosphatase PhoE
MNQTNDRSLAPVPVYLVRHGVTPWNRDGLVQGWTDIPLSEIGRAQAERLAEALRDVRFDRVITSSLCRAKETADLIVRDRGVTVEQFEDLREYGCGSWEGRPFLEVRATERDRFWAWFNDPEVSMPGGESMGGASRRAVPVIRRVLSEMTSSEGALLVVAHGGVNRLIAADLLGLELGVAKRLRLDNASLSIFEPFLGGYALKLWNSVSHLNGLSDTEEGSTASRIG